MGFWVSSFLSLFQFLTALYFDQRASQQCNLTVVRGIGSMMLWLSAFTSGKGMKWFLLPKSIWLTLLCQQETSAFFVANPALQMFICPTQLSPDFAVENLSDQSPITRGGDIKIKYYSYVLITWFSGSLLRGGEGESQFAWLGCVVGPRHWMFWGL